jgi:hypothetical protein
VKLAHYFSEKTHRGQAPMGALGGAIGGGIGVGYSLYKNRIGYPGVKGKFRMAGRALAAIGVGAGAGAGIGHLVRTHKAENA